MFARRKARSRITNKSRGRLSIERLEDRRMLAGQSLFVPPAPPIYGPVRPPIIAPANPVNYSIALVSGGAGLTDIGANNSISNADGPETGFILSGAPVGAAYTFRVTSSGGGTPITGSGGVDANTPQYVLGIDVAMLHNGTLTYTVQVTSGGTTSVITATTNLDQTAPSGYGISAPNSIVLTDLHGEPIVPNTVGDTGFMFINAALGDTYSYTVTSSGGGIPVTGSGTVTGAAVGPRPTYPGEIVPDYMMWVLLVTDINVSSLSAGTLTFSVTVSNGAGTGMPATATSTLSQSGPFDGPGPNALDGPAPPPFHSAVLDSSL